MLMAPFTIQEICKVVFSFPPNKASILDGFFALFYQNYWDIIGWDLLTAIEESRKTKILKNFNNSQN